MGSKTKNILKASFWLLAVSWYTRILSMLTIIVLARNLDKQDFGILAACFVVQSFFNVLSNVGSGQYLIRKAEISEHDINAAWTIGIFSKFSVAFLIFVLSGFAADFMKIPEISSVLKVMSLSAIFMGLHNPAINIKIKQLDYSKIAYLGLITKSISSTVSIIIAVVYQTYWAVIISEILYNLIYAIGSQFVVKHRPQLVIKNINNQWQFSKWVLLKGVVSYIKVACDKIIVSRGYSVGDLGLYNFANESANTAMQFLITPINKVLYPGLSEYINDKEMLVDKVYKSVLALSCVYVPIVFGGIYLSEQIVPIVFGNKWIEAIPLFNVFLAMTFARMLIGVFTDVFTLTGEVKKQFFYESVTSVIFLVIMLSVSSLSLEDFAMSRSLVAYLMLTILVLTLQKIIPISLIKTIIIISPLAIAVGVMLSLLNYSSIFIEYNEVVFLIISILLGAFFYSTALLAVIALFKNIFVEYDFLYKTFILPVYNLVKKKVNKV